MKTENINILSCFDGMSMLQIALDRANIKYDNYYSSEIDEYAMKITQSNYPNTIQLGDITKLSDEQLLELDIDLLVGGFPCQNFSFAGTRKGMSTECEIEVVTLEQYLKLKDSGFNFRGQSYLFWELLRIKNLIQPKYFLFENVRMSSKWEKVINQALELEPIKVNSSDFSAQNRERLFWTSLDFSKPKLKNTEVISDILDNKMWSTVKPNTIFHKNYAKWMLNSWGKGKSRLETFFNINRKASTLLANMAKGHKCSFTINDNKEIHKFTVSECERLQTVPIGYTNTVSNSRAYHALGNGFTVDVIVAFVENIGKEKTNRPIQRDLFGDAA